MTIQEGMGTQIAFLPHDGPVGGGVVEGDGYVPGADGPVVYLNGGDDLSVVLDRVEEAGRQVVLPKTPIGEHGFAAFVMDTEGNKVGLIDGLELRPLARAHG